MYTWKISGYVGRRKVVTPTPHMLLRLCTDSQLYNAGLIKNRHDLFVLSEHVQTPALPTSRSQKTPVFYCCNSISDVTPAPPLSHTAPPPRKKEKTKRSKSSQSYGENQKTERTSMVVINSHSRWRRWRWTK